MDIDTVTVGIDEYLANTKKTRNGIDFLFELQQLNPKYKIISNDEVVDFLIDFLINQNKETTNEK